jgi:hypothetical protein
MAYSERGWALRSANPLVTAHYQADAYRRHRAAVDGAAPSIDNRAPTRPQTAAGPSKRHYLLEGACGFCCAGVELNATRRLRPR